MSNGRRSAAVIAELDQEIADTEAAYADALRMKQATRDEADRAADLFQRIERWREAIRKARFEYLETHREEAP